MANSTLQKIANNNADPLIKSGQAAEFDPEGPERGPHRKR